MALFVLGAGATRGASFVNPADNPCLPPLDLDFYAQLQRIANLKHKQTVRDVIKDTVDLFGVNFQVTMESVFTTLEQTSRMIETTGENRDFKRSDLDKKKQHLMQAIAATLEESLCAGGQRVGTECGYHRTLVDIMKPSDSIITFNYDCLISVDTSRRESKRANAHRDWSHLARRKPATSRAIAGSYGGHRFSGVMVPTSPARVPPAVPTR